MSMEIHAEHEDEDEELARGLEEFMKIQPTEEQKVTERESDEKNEQHHQSNEYMSHLENEVRDLKSKVQEYQMMITTIERMNGNLENRIKECETLIGDMEKSHKGDKEEIKRLNDATVALQKENEVLQSQIDGYASTGSKNTTDVNEALQKEATEYQSRLDDRDNNTRLTQDIVELQNNINTYAIVKKGVELNMNAVKRGLLEFGCFMESTTNSSDEKEDNEKQLTKVLLRRVVLKTIMDETDKYLQGTNFDGEGLRELINNARDLTVYRVGKDETSSVALTKLRQQIFSFLGDQAFSDIHLKNGVIKHPFIVEVSRVLDQEISKYRLFKNIEKKKEYDELALDIIREVVRIFYFSCKAQEPEIEFRWFDKGEKIDPTTMQGFWDDQIVQWSVDLCYFPLIGTDLKSEKHRKVLYAARVLATKKKDDIFTKATRDAILALSRAAS